MKKRKPASIMAILKGWALSFLLKMTLFSSTLTNAYQKTGK